MISPAAAEAAIRSHVPLLPAVSMPLTALTGATLREPLLASLDQPPFDRVTMDGIALASSAYERGQKAFRIAATQAAGAPPLTLQNSGECIEVMTGAILPAGCDCVIPVEKLSVQDGVAHLMSDTVPARNLNVHGRGIDSRRGATLLEAGTRLGPAEIAVLAANGQTHALVSRVPRLSLISTGDELVEPGQPLEPWQIYRSNAFGVFSALQRRSPFPMTLDHLPDDPAVLRTRLAAHLATCDALILSGGVSMGRYDYIPQVLGELGVQVVFHKVSQRPGKPLWFGIGAQGQTVYALPGNPVSTLVCLVRYALAGLEAAQGTRPRPVATVPLAESFEVKPALTLFLPVTLRLEPGQRWAEPRPTRGSGDFTSLIGTDGFVELPPGPQVVARGTPVPLYCW